MSKRASVVWCLVGLLLAFATVQMVSPRDASAQETYEMDYYIFVGFEHPVGKNALQFADLVEERTNGRLEVNVRPAGELPYKATEMMRVVGRNSVQIGDAYNGFIGGDVPIAVLPALPQLVFNMDELKTAIDIVRPYLDKEFEKRGVSFLYWYAWPLQKTFGSGEPIRNLSDIEGLKVRGTAPTQLELFRKLGATPVTLTTAEVPTAMRRGVMDAVLTAAFNAYGAGWGEFLDWVYTLPINAAPSYILVNNEAVANLPDDLRETLFQAARDHQANLLEKIPASEQDNLRKLTEEHGVQQIEPAPGDRQKAIDTIKEYWGEWANEQVGPEGVEALKKVREALGR